LSNIFIELYESTVEYSNINNAANV
jgi:hypothetical protein